MPKVTRATFHLRGSIVVVCAVARRLRPITTIPHHGSGSAAPRRPASVSDAERGNVASRVSRASLSVKHYLRRWLLCCLTPVSVGACRGNSEGRKSVGRRSVVGSSWSGTDKGQHNTFETRRSSLAAATRAPPASTSCSCRHHRAPAHTLGPACRAAQSKWTRSSLTWTGA